MVHVLGVNIPDQKLVRIALTSFYGIGPATASRLCAKLSFHDTATVSSLTETQIAALANELSTMTIENDLRRAVRENIAHHRAIGTYVGRRHAMSLPVRGQRTRNNSKTARRLNRIERRGICTLPEVKDAFRAYR